MALNKNILTIFRKLISLVSACNTSNRELVDFVADLFKSDGRFQIKLWPIKIDNYYVYNLLIKLAGKSKTSPFIFAAHSDTVPTQPALWSSSPFKFKNLKGRIFGLGVTDMKGALALMIYQLLSIKGVPAQDIYLCLTADEEASGLGIKKMVVELKRRKIKSALTILGEPTNGQIRLGQKACLSYCLFLKNKRSGHAAYFTQQKNILLNPLQQASFIALALNEWVKKQNKKYGLSSEYGGVTFNLGRLRGGDSSNVLPASSEMEFEFRFPPLSAYTNLNLLDKQIKSIILQQVSPSLEVKLINNFKGEFYKLAINDPVIKDIQQIYKSVLGRPSKIFYGLGWTEASYYQSFGKVVILGPGRPDQAHRINEYIEEKKMIEIMQVYKNLLENYKNIKINN